MVEKAELDWRCEFPLLDADDLSSDLCRHAPARLGLHDLDRRLLPRNTPMLLVLPLARNGHCRGVALSQCA
jgi:hypothetical protein